MAYIRRSSPPGRGNATDPGLAAIQEVYRLWQVEERWSIREQRGFTWWAGDFRQHISVDEGREDHGAFVYKLSAVTDLLSAVDPDRPSTRHWIANLNILSGSYALVLEEHTRSVFLTSSVLFHEQSANWAVSHFAALAIMQVVDAEQQAETYAEMLAAAPNRSRHPRSGIRRHGDQMLDVVEDIYKPLGQEQSKWIATGEFEELLPALQQAGSLFSTGGRYGLTTEIAFGTDSALIRATGSEPHHQLGNGLRLSLTLPVALSEEAANALSVELNAAEAERFTRSHFLGAWTVKEARGGHVPEFISFVPNVLYQRGLLFNLILSLGLKARWARNEISPYATDESLDKVLRGRFGRMRKRS